MSSRSPFFIGRPIEFYESTKPGAGGVRGRTVFIDYAKDEAGGISYARGDED